MRRVRCKICGITQSQDLLAATDAGADAIGLVFYPKSPRAVTLVQAERLLKQLPPLVTSVGLLVNPEQAEVLALLDRLPLQLLQFHGDERAEFCAQFGKPYLKALRVPTEAAWARYSAAERSAKLAELNETLQTHQRLAQGWLIDALDDRQFGGTGKVPDYGLLAQLDWAGVPLILAGGLKVDSVADAIERVQPWAVDVSSGVEQGVPGVKSPALIRQFLNQVRSTDQS